MKTDDEFSLKKFFKLSLIIVISVIIGIVIGINSCSYIEGTFCSDVTGY